MRDWSGRSNMEWYLMKILEEGAFLLDKPEDQAGTRIHVEPRSAKDSIAAEDFYDAAVQGLFEIVDDPGAGGIPEGLLELGNAILRKLDPKLHHAVRKFFISKWLFSVFLLNAIIHPETYGMMSEYHISEYGRQKILKEVAMRAQKLVITKLWEPKSSTPPNIKEHIDSIMARFRPTRPSKSNAKLLPARSITSLRETAEVHPYLVLGPADLMAMINALFPDRRPASSSLSKEHFNGLRSGGSSISGISATSRAVPIPAPRGAFDNMSVISNSASSVISEATTSQEPLLNNSSNSNQRFSPASQPYNAQPQRLSYYEDDGFELRMAIHEMTQTLGVDAVSGTCHPCAENWAVLFIAPDGQKLSPQMKHDPDDEAEEEEEYTSSNDSDEDITSARPDLDKDYHQLRDSILKLVEDYEIPQSLDSPQESKTFSNRTSNLESPRRKIRSKPPTASQPQSNNPYRLHQTPSMVEAGKRQDTKTKASNLEGRQPLDSESPPILIAMLEAAEKQCQAQSDFVNAHLYWKTLNQLHQLSSKSLKQDGYASLLSIFSRGPRDIIRRSTSAVEEYDAWLVWLKQSQERHDIIIDSMMKRLKSLRDKMWYVTDVRNSKPYENARSIAVALKWMAAPKKSPKLPLTSMRPRNNSRLSSTNNFLLKSETQILAEIAASEEQGGPNKLSDEQSENTQRWLSQFGIENFCKGEERIHRFCLEIEACINKLVGDNLVDAPDLWSSDLYFRDKRILDSGRQRGDTLLNNFRSLNLSGDDINESETGRRGLRSTDFNRTGSRDLRSMSMRNGSQQSFDSGRYSMSRISTSGDMFDTHDYFGMASPVLTIDSSTTFWSPFQTRTQSPTTSMSSVRPGTSSSTNETVMLREERASLAKQRFITDLKQTLTSLLISDLGTLVFSQGSETDSWFSSDLGQDCMDRKERVERRARKKNKRRTLEKKRSFRDLRSAQITDVPFERPDSIHERPDKGANVHSIAESSSTNDTVISGARKAAREADSRKNIVKDMESPDFPYRNAFQRLLRMFSVHPNPYAKLNALYELEQLIIAYLTPSNTRRPRLRSDAITSSSPDVHQVSSLAAGDPMPNTPRAKNLEEAIDNCKERRSHTIGSTPASTDMIVDVLQDLFRDADIRPKTLFRDLQFIASFVPAPILDKTERGKAFWDAGLAALGLKQDVCRTMIEVADEIVQHDIKQVERRKTSSVNDALPPVTASSEVLKYGMEDAAKMLTITAKEGEPAAERELGIFYIAHPDLVEKVTAPLSKPRETFKAQVMDMHGGGNASRADPATMCIAFHWMELSAIGGDDLAKRYLRQRESQEINEIP
ncbi:hypothetical protein B0O99DRAFT_654637 [Bisporella sp. PMI_857]|nr:hypothetical protein B0O99DRAFT_654637 [Bisporella sp. PMI_857]